MSFCCNFDKDINFMGSGYKLYFIFIKYAGFLMFFMFIGVGIINCYINSIGQDCISEHELEKLLEKVETN